MKHYFIRYQCTGKKCDYFLAPSLQILLDSNNPKSIALVHLQMIYENQTY